MSGGFRSRECLLEMPFRDKHAPMVSQIEAIAKLGVPSMLIPKHVARITIVDDLPECILAIGSALAAWPRNVEFEGVLQRFASPLPIPSETGIVLLDEKMDALTGEEVAKGLKELGFPGIICSTSTSFTAYHDFKFEGKRQILLGEYGPFVEQFIAFMNGIFKVDGFGGAACPDRRE